MAESDKPSFLRSTLSGMSGYVKGFFAGGAFGALAGAAVGLGIGLLTGGAGFALISQTAVVGAALFAGVGAASGAMTEVVRSRETGQLTASDAVTVAKSAYAQGVGVTLQQVQAMEEQSSKWRDRYAREQDAKAKAKAQTQLV